MSKDTSWSAKIDDVNKERLLLLIDESGLTAKDFLNTMIVTYEMNNAKVHVKEIGEDITEVQQLTQRISNVFVGVAERIETIKLNAETNKVELLEQKETLIATLTENVSLKKKEAEDLLLENNSLKEMNVVLRTECDDIENKYKKDSEQFKTTNENNQALISQYKEKLEDQKGIIEDSKEKMAKYEMLSHDNEECSRKYKILESENDKLTNLNEELRSGLLESKEELKIKVKELQEESKKQNENDKIVIDLNGKIGNIKLEKDQETSRLLSVIKEREQEIENIKISCELDKKEEILKLQSSFNDKLETAQERYTKKLLALITEYESGRQTQIKDNEK
jgi:myosin heavy subunit